MAGIQEREVVRIDSHSKLDGHRNALCIAHGSANDVAQKIRLHRNRRAAALSRDFRNRTPEIHIEMIDAAFTDETLHSFGNIVRIRPVQLETSRRFLRPELRKLS